MLTEKPFFHHEPMEGARSVGDFLVGLSTHFLYTKAHLPHTSPEYGSVSSSPFLMTFLLGLSSSLPSMSPLSPSILTLSNDLSLGPSTSPPR